MGIRRAAMVGLGLLFFFFVAAWAEHAWPRGDITASDRATWTATTVEVWAGESYAIARAKETEYCIIAGNSCVYEAGNETYDTGETEKVVVVDDAYLERQEPVVTERLKRAGVRLAFLLNTTLGK